MSSLNGAPIYGLREAADLSCDAMSQLAAREADRNAGRLDFMINDPTCERWRQLADRGVEDRLQKTLGSFRKLCVDKMPDYQKGPWTHLFGDGTATPRFEQWTKAKQPQQPGAVPGTPGAGAGSSAAARITQNSVACGTETFSCLPEKYGARY